MKKLFLAASFTDVSQLFKEFLSNESQKQTVTFIPAASVPEEVPFYVDEAKDVFKSLSIKVDEIDISTISYEEIAARLKKNDLIYLSGGNTFYLMQELKKSGADRLINSLSFNK